MVHVMVDIWDPGRKAHEKVALRIQFPPFVGMPRLDLWRAVIDLALVGIHRQAGTRDLSSAVDAADGLWLFLVNPV